MPDNWRAYFDALQNVPAADGIDGPRRGACAGGRVLRRSAPRPTPSATAPSSADLAIARKQVHVQSLIAAYRSLGSRWADLDPLKRQERPKIPELEPAFYDLTEADMDMVFSATQHLLHDRRAA